MTILRRAALPAALRFAAAGAAAQGAPAGGVVPSRPWIAALPPGAATAAGYLAIANEGETADRLLSVAADFAGKAPTFTASPSTPGAR